jgi:hypothetical protein
MEQRAGIARRWLGATLQEAPRSIALLLGMLSAFVAHWGY